MSPLDAAKARRLRNLFAEDRYGLRALLASLGPETCYPAKLPQFFARFSAPRSDSAKIV